MCWSLSQLQPDELRQVTMVSLLAGSLVVNASAAYYTAEAADMFLKAVKCCVGAAFSQVRWMTNGTQQV